MDRISLLPKYLRTLLFYLQLVHICWYPQRTILFHLTYIYLFVSLSIHCSNWIDHKLFQIQYCLYKCSISFPLHILFRQYLLKVFMGYHLLSVWGVSKGTLYPNTPNKRVIELNSLESVVEPWVSVLLGSMKLCVSCFAWQRYIPLVAVCSADLMAPVRFTDSMAYVFSVNHWFYVFCGSNGIYGHIWYTHLWLNLTWYKIFFLWFCHNFFKDGGCYCPWYW